MLSKKRKDGASERDHLLMEYNATGIMPEALANEVQLPESIAHVWGYFEELHLDRTNNGFGPNRITSTNIKDWCELNRIRLERWEIQAIRRIDLIWFESIGTKE